jgi:peptidoglycan hydrolase-like protein with peptidoglycan-binding domain
MDSPDPVGLYLIYDKYEKNSDGIPFNQFLNYREYINAVPAYNYVVEESEVIDPSSFNKRVYSTQMFAHKENKLLKNNTNDDGWKIITPKKAIQDPRTFQNFNWRLLAKINYNFSKNKDIHESAERARLNVAVLYSGLIENMENPYVFANLEESVINQQNFLFENPLASSEFTKSQRQYWALNIDEFVSTQVATTNADAFSYDFLVWTPNKTINEQQKRIIDMFLSNGVSVFIDCSSLDQSSLSASGLSNFDFTLSSTSNNTGLIKIVDEYIDGDQSLNAWDMSAYNESSIGNYGIFGDRKNILSNNSVNQIRVFNGTPESSDGSARSIAYIEDGNKKYSAILKDKYDSSSEFSSFAIYCVNPFLTFINDNYGGSGLSVSGKNKGTTNSFPTGREGSQTGLLSEAVIGPNKMFYNIICESNRNKVNSRQQYSDASVIVWNISPWRNSWTVNGKPDSNGVVTVLFEDEKKTFNFGMKKPEFDGDYTTQQITNIFCREIDVSIGDLLINDFEATSNEVDAATMINPDFSNVEFYLECSNDNVKFLNFEKIDNSNYIFSNVKTSYSIHKMSNVAKNKMAGSSLSIDAYSIVYSRQFDLDSIYYPYVILDYSDYISQVNSVIKTPKEYLPGSQFVKDYDYAFKTQLFVTEVKTNRYNYEVNWSTNFKMSLNGESSSVTITTKKAIPEEPDGSSKGIYGAYVVVTNVDGNTSYSSTDYQPIPVRNKQSPFYLYRYPTNVFSVTDIMYRKFKDKSHTRNNFHYTNDLPITKYWNEYMDGQSKGAGGGGVGGGGGGVGAGVDSSQVMVADTSGVTGITLRGKEFNLNAPTDPKQSAANKEKLLFNIITEKGALWSVMEDATHKVFGDLYWFKASNKVTGTDKNLPDFNTVRIVYDQWLFFEKWYLNVTRAIPSSIAKSLDEKIKILHTIYQSDLGQYKTFKFSQLFNSDKLSVPVGTTGKKFFEILFRKFLTFFEIYTPVVKTTSPGGGKGGGGGGGGGGTNNAPSQPAGYVSYIQYTLKCNNIPVTIDGKYGPQTAAAVRKFQSDKKLNLIDAIVDSETKSILALFWLDLYKYNRARYGTLVNQAPKGVEKFIAAAVLYSDIEKVYDGSNSSEYRRISYTGIPGPTTIVDHIVVEVPEVEDEKSNPVPWQEISDINIKAGDWPVTVKKVWMYQDDLGLGEQRVPEFVDNPIRALPQNIFAVDRLISPNEEFSISVPSTNRAIKYIMLELSGGSLTAQDRAVYGPNAEGFSLKNINFTIKTPVKGKSGEPATTKSGNYKFTAIASGSISGETNITSGDFGVFRLGSVSDSNAYPGSSINSVVINSVYIKSEVKDEKGDPILDEDGQPTKIDFTHNLTNSQIYSPSTGFDNKEISFSKDGITYTIEAPSQSTGLSNINPSISSVIRTSGPTGTVTLSQSDVNSQFDILKNMAPIYQVVTTNGVEIESKEYSREYDVSGYYVADADSSGLNYKQNKKLSINAKDGAVVLTNDLGNPIGFPNYSEFVQPQDSSTGTTVEVSFGNTLLKWNLKDSNGTLMPAPDGLQWGFYNIVTRQFLGKKFTYQYYMQNKRNIYIGLIAFDADRDSATTDNIIGIENRTGTLREFQFPAKSICPIYSVRVSDRAKIAISNPPKDLSKFDNWFINLSRGRFFKNITLPINSLQTDWRKNYHGQTLRCFYDTTKIAIPSSGIFGSGYYDIFDENPIIVSRNEIQLRHGSFHTTQEVLDKPNISTYHTDASPIECWVDIKIKDAKGNWLEINEDQIKNYSKHTGTIYFEKEIIPSNPENIQVNYVVKNPNIMMYKLNGKEIPSNPYVFSINQLYIDSNGQPGFSSNPYKFIDSAIHFYIVPSAVQVLENGEYVEVDDYETPKSVVDFTFNYSIFDPKKLEHNPLALHLGTVTVNKKFDINQINVIDLRLKGGGVKPLDNTTKSYEEKPNILNFADLNSGKGYLYPNGGYVIIKIPKEVKQNFNSIEEVYNIVRSNLTAGVAFDIQDMDGNDWRTL